MHILIITAGSRGDVQPFIALGKGLMSAGHQVTLCTTSNFESFVCIIDERFTIILFLR